MRPTPYFYKRRPTRTVFVGQIGIGGKNPIRIQSMVTSDTKDTVSVVREIEELVQAGCEIIRLTVPTKADCLNLKNIRHELKQRNIRVPLVADIHFTPTIAMDVVEFVEKVRINPGNFVDKKLFKTHDYTDAEYAEEIARIEEKFIPLVLKCKEYGVAMRIGTNHGSLSDRIMNRYGDSPEGMVESAMEFARLAASQNYHDLIFSMKASNTQVMVAAYRLLVQRMQAENMDYPLHLGVTEAGDGEDGRIKSSVGIGTLLAEGIGDTIRVSLTEDSVHEIPVAGMLAAPANQMFYSNFFNDDQKNSRTPKSQKQNSESTQTDFDFGQRYHASYERRKSTALKCGRFNFGGIEVPRVWTALSNETQFEEFLRSQTADMQYEGIEIDAELYTENFFKNLTAQGFALAVQSTRPAILLECQSANKLTLLMGAQTEISAMSNLIAQAKKDQLIDFCLDVNSFPFFTEILSRTLSLIKDSLTQHGKSNACLSLVSDYPMQDYRTLAATLKQLDWNAPLHLRYNTGALPVLTDAPTQFGSLLLDGLGDSVQIDGSLSFKEKINLSYGILQACRVRISKTEFIACPSCGRTLFDLQEVTAKIRARTSHLKGLKIAIMGCIVNGPGEMADADFGYVGTGTSKISLYVGKECVKRNIPEENALDELIALIKDHGRWIEAA